MISEKRNIDWMIGAGYMHYQSQSLKTAVERDCKKGFLGVNADLTLTRHLYKSLYMGANISVVDGLRHRSKKR